MTRLDALKALLPEWEFYWEEFGTSGSHGFRFFGAGVSDAGKRYKTTREFFSACFDGAHVLCGEIERALIEREDVLYVEAVVGPGECKVRIHTGPLAKAIPPVIADTKLDALLDALREYMETR